MRNNLLHLFCILYQNPFRKLTIYGGMIWNHPTKFLDFPHRYFIFSLKIRSSDANFNKKSEF